MAVTTWTAGQVLAAQDLNDTFASKLDVAGGKILQVVRATDSTSRSTTSTSYVDASISVTITPQKNTSAVLLVWSLLVDNSASGREMRLQITDASDNSISGSSETSFFAANTRMLSSQIIIAYATPATTAATTYKGRFRSTLGTSVLIGNGLRIGQLYAIEVSA